MMTSAKLIRIYPVAHAIAPSKAPRSKVVDFLETGQKTIPVDHLSGMFGKFLSCPQYTKFVKSRNYSIRNRVYLIYIFYVYTIVYLIYEVDMYHLANI